MLRDLLHEHGLEFPCGGVGRCRRCRVRVLEGEVGVDPVEEAQLSPEELARGWRLACRIEPTSDLTLEVAAWAAPILADDTPFDFRPRPGHGIAVDCGTTTLVAQLLDLETGRVLGVESALNPQGRHGADVMTRIEHALGPGGASGLTELIRDGIAGLVTRLVDGTPAGRVEVEEIVVVGNTTMHHLFSGLDITPLSHTPFDSPLLAETSFESGDLGWSVPGGPLVRFLACGGGFVGSDVLAGALATQLHQRERLTMLVDLGTNGEIVLGNREGLLCASTAAGPAFEGGRIRMGMQATSGAISEVSVHGGELACRVIGRREPRGICGSGLVDAVAAALDLDLVAPNGRLKGGHPLELEPPVKLWQSDIRELQLAKAAVAAGVRILLDRWGAAGEDVDAVYLGGAFGNYVSRGSARRIGLIDFPEERVNAAGNTALLGAKLELVADGTGAPDVDDMARSVEHVALAADPAFQDVFVEEMRFP
jgi:uncharacterized 2Fe-2S/4Fe-4S cluster protein (DUF4445 family)